VDAKASRSAFICVLLVLRATTRLSERREGAPRERVPCARARSPPSAPSAPSRAREGKNCCCSSPRRRTLVPRGRVFRVERPRVRTWPRRAARSRSKLLQGTRSARRAGEVHFAKILEDFPSRGRFLYLAGTNTLELWILRSCHSRSFWRSASSQLVKRKHSGSAH